MNPNATPKDAFLVEVVDRVPGGNFSVVSVATRPPQRGSKLPAAIRDHELETQRGFAAQHGAEHLVVERIDNAYRKVFYLLGLTRERTEAAVAGPPPSW